MVGGLVNATNTVNASGFLLYRSGEAFAKNRTSSKSFIQFQMQELSTARQSIRNINYASRVMNLCG